MNGAGSSSARTQHGAALFMALIFLLIMTILGIFGMNLSRMENLMAGNNQSTTQALNNAELMLDAGMREIESNIGPPYINPDKPGDHIYLNRSGASEIIDPGRQNWNFNSVSTPPPGGNPNHTFNYVIQYIGTLDGSGNGNCSAATGTGGPLDDCGRETYLVTSQSTAGRSAKRTIQSVFVSADLM